MYFSQRSGSSVLLHHRRIQPTFLAIGFRFSSLFTQQPKRLSQFVVDEAKERKINRAKCHIWNLCAHLLIRRLFSSSVPCSYFTTPFASCLSPSKNHKHGTPQHYINIGRGHSLCPESHERFMHPNRSDHRNPNPRTAFRYSASSFEQLGAFYATLYASRVVVEIAQSFIRTLAFISSVISRFEVWR